MRAVVVFAGLLAVLAAGTVLWLVFFAVRPWRRPTAPPAASWGTFQALEVLIMWTFVSLVAGQMAGRFFGGVFRSAAGLMTVLYVLTGAAALAWFWLASLDKGSRTAAALGWRGFRGVFAGIAGYCATLPLLAAVWLAMRAFLPDPTPGTPALPIVAGATGVVDRTLVAFLAILAAPVFEETLFRGILYGALRRRMRPAAAIAVSGAVFGLAHLDLVGAVPLAALGMVFAYLYERTGSLTAPAVAHGLTNAGTVLLTMVI
jgi:hypothetical protein